jgi:tRNA(Arg) A34 adenosine deaminase TadA
MTDEDGMRLAIRVAMQGIEQGQTPFGACLVKDGSVISCAHNVVWDSLDITAHAEIHAIREACRILQTVNLSGCILYSTCEPCPMCFSACHWARIAGIVYGARIEDARAIGFYELGISSEKMRQLGGSPVLIRGDCLREDCLALFAAWSKRADKRSY